MILASLASIAAFATKDKWMPIDYVFNVAQQSDRRLYPPMPIRAAIIVDRVAGPRDRIDVHGGHDTYLYPVYGGTLSRNVAFITAPAGIRRDAQWVIVDRASNIFWHHPLFKTVEDWHRYWSLGEASAEDLSVVKTLMADKRFQVVFYSPRINQAVFRRVQ